MGIFDYFTKFYKEENPEWAVPEAATIKELLHENATPVFAKMGIHPIKNSYRWASDYNEHGIQKVIHFRYRSANGNFLLGTNFKFLPVINTKQKIVYKRKELHLYESLDVMIPEKYKISLQNAQVFETSLKKLLKKQSSQIEHFFQDLETIPQNLALTLQQIESKSAIYYLHDPHVKYILPFLHAKLGDKEKAISTLHTYLELQEETPKEILQYLDKV